MSITENVNIVDPKDNYRGLSYGQLIMQWNNWFVSSGQEETNGPVCFLRGSAYQIQGEFKQYKRMGPHAVHINANTAIFFPLISATAWQQAFPTLTTDGLLRADVRNDIDGGSVLNLYAKYIDDKDVEHDIVPEIKKYRAESPPFTLEVPTTYLGAEQRVWDNVQVSEGSSSAVSDGYWLLIRPLSPLSPPNKPYRLHFGGPGKSPYSTDSLYDIVVDAAPQQWVTYKRP